MLLVLCAFVCYEMQFFKTFNKMNAGTSLKDLNVIPLNGIWRKGVLIFETRILIRFISKQYSLYYFGGHDLEDVFDNFRVLIIWDIIIHFDRFKNNYLETFSVNSCSTSKWEGISRDIYYDIARCISVRRQVARFLKFLRHVKIVYFQHNVQV